METWFQQTKFRVQIFLLGMTIFCPAFFIYMLVSGETRRQIASYRWPTTEGEVMAPVAKTWTDSEGRTKYYGRVSYRYTVAGRTYTTDLTDLGPGSKVSDPQTALADVSQYPPGAKVTVYYDPDDPSVGVLEKGIPLIHKILLGVLGALTAIGALVSVFTVRQFLRWLRRKPTPA